MKIIRDVLRCFLMLILFIACDSNHLQEFSRINRDDIAGYEAFIAKYPTSSLVADARERIAVAKESQEQCIAEEARRRLIDEYGNNSLLNDSQPYSQWYGYNEYIDDHTPHSEIQVKAPSNSDVVVIVRYNNQNGKVAAHKYIKAGHSSTLYLKNDNRYQTFFYYGKGWCPEKEMSNGVKGGFVIEESFSKDGNEVYLNNNVLSYELQLQEHGNFRTSSSNETEMF